MARPRRIHRPGGFYHVTLRGNHRQDIFQTPEDRRRLESLVAHASRGTGARIHAYCWMTNHIHLLAEVGAQPLGTLIQRTATPYAKEMHKRLGTTGHLFQRRHFARLVDTERDLLNVIRYTHFNPVRGGLAARPSDYPWSSHHAYLGHVDYPWLATEYALGMLGATDHEARLAYRQFMSEAEGTNLPSPFADEGSAPAVGAALDGLINEVCLQRGISVEEARSRSCGRNVNAARVEIARRAITQGIANLSQVAGAFGRTASALAQSLKRHQSDTAREMPDLHSPCRP